MVRFVRNHRLNKVKEKSVGLFIASAPLAYLAWLTVTASSNTRLWAYSTVLITGLFIVGFFCVTHFQKNIFLHSRLESLWQTVEDRLARLDQACNSMKGQYSEDLTALQARVNHTAKTVFEALLRADLLQSELRKSEGSVSSPAYGSQVHQAPSSDKQVQELYRIADKHVAEYRNRIAGLMAGIERCEAQATVFVTTLDTLRVRLLGYRLSGSNPEMEHKYFLESIGDVKQQLDAVDLALDSLSLERLASEIELAEATNTERVSEIIERYEASTIKIPPALPDDVVIEQKNT